MMQLTEQQWSEWEQRSAERLGNDLKDLRSAAGLSQAKLAEAAGLPRSIVSNIEYKRLKTMPSVSTIVRLALALGVPPISLVYRDVPDGPVEVAPGLELSAIDGVRWFGGEIPLDPLEEYPSPEIARLKASRTLARMRQMQFDDDLPTSSQPVRVGDEPKISTGPPTVQMNFMVPAIKSNLTKLARQMREKGWTVDSDG
ncbi:helix-turn-helix domain-containing protein [Rhodococcoides fascians]|uniref:helix-turn-helix domain-containing protein n=1 Tax=Rhodococcoides fascians TaxID=1828 RepID=UPI0006907AAE|nr:MULTISPECIES: helix-turn-helix transcriptional regulator [Rhodococcus]